jgi:hypothetical protein
MEEDLATNSSTANDFVVATMDEELRTGSPISQLLQDYKRPPGFDIRDAQGFGRA